MCGMDTASGQLVSNMPNKKKDRHGQIANAAYRILAEKGYRGLTMTGLARAVGASNETLYKWYGDKDGLICALIEENSAQAKAILEISVEVHRDPIKTLRRLAPVLLTLMTGNRGVALNRAAASDPSGRMGEMMKELGRDAILPLIGKVIDNGVRSGVFKGHNEPLLDIYLSLLLGDGQMQQAIGAMPIPIEDTRNTRAQRAVDQFLVLAGKVQ